MTQDKIEMVVEEYVRTRFRVQADDVVFGREVNMWENGYVDSAGVVELLAFLETTFQIKLSEEAFFDPDFTNICGIARAVHREVERRHVETAC